MDEGTTVGGLAASIGRGLAKAAVIGVVNGTERDLVRPLADGDTVEIVTAESPRGLYTIRHSTAHVLAQAVLDLFPGATFAIGPPVEDGFYYDFELPAGADGKPATFEPDDLDRIEARMREIIAEAQPFVRDEIPNERGPRGLRRPPVQAGDHRRRGRGPHLGHRGGHGPHLREPAGRAQGAAAVRRLPASSTCAGAPTCPTPRPTSATSS